MTTRSIKEIAKSAVSGSPITNGKEKIPVQELIATYPNGIHIDGFDTFMGDNGKFPVFSYVEDDSRYFYGGAVLSGMVEALLREGGGDLTTINEELKRDPLHIVLSNGKNKRGQQITRVNVVD